MTARYLTWSERRAREHRRERLIRYAAVIAGLVLPMVIAWVAVGAVLAR